MQRPVPGVPPVEHDDPRSLARYGRLRLEGAVWVLSCDEEQTHALTGVAAAAAFLVGPFEVFLGAAVGYIELVDALGGGQGVDINGVFGVPGVVVTPRGSQLFEATARLGRRAMTGRTITEAIARAAASDMNVASVLGLPGVAGAFQQIASGTPLGWALAAATGYAVDLLSSPPDINAHGAVLADRGDAREWELFTIGTTGATDPAGTPVTILSWLGHFSAQMGGGHGVYANRPEVGPWEIWTEIKNGDGTYSYRTENGCYLCAEMGGGRECQANRPQIGDWEKFYKVPIGGRYALQTKVHAKFVSVQRDS